MCYLVLWNGVKQLPDSHLRNGNLADMCVVFKFYFVLIALRIPLANWLMWHRLAYSSLRVVKGCKGSLWDHQADRNV